MSVAALSSQSFNPTEKHQRNNTQKLPNIPIAQNILAEEKSTISKDLVKKNITQKEYLKSTLGHILSDHLQPIVELIHGVISDVLNDKDCDPVLASRILTAVAFVFSKLLPNEFRNLSNITDHLPPEKIKEHTLIYMAAVKSLINDVLSDKELKNNLVNMIVDVALDMLLKGDDEPIIKPLVKFTPKEKNVITGVFNGINAFFNDFIEATKTSSQNINLLKESNLESQALENSIIESMNHSLVAKGKINLSFEQVDPVKLKEGIYNITKVLFSDLIPESTLSLKEKEALIDGLALLTARSTDMIFSKRMIFYLIRTLLSTDIAINSSPNTEPKESAATLPNSYVHTNFGQKVGNHLQNLISYIVRLASGNTYSNMALQTIIYCFFQIYKSVTGIEVVKIIQELNQSSDWSATIGTAYNFLYQAESEGKAVPTLIKQFEKSDDEINAQKRLIEQELNDQIFFKKINDAFKNYLKSEPKKPIQAFFWDFFNNNSNMLKSLTGNLSNSLYIIMQRENLMKMLYCYIGSHIHQEM